VIAEPALDILLDHATISGRIAEMARQIEADYPDGPVLLVGILKGSLHFLSDLGRNLRIDTQIDFIQASSYHGGRESRGVVQILKDLDINIAGLDVLIVEDIVDKGLTINYLRTLLATRQPRSVRVASLLSKPNAHTVETVIDYVGFEIPNEFVVGYGLDYAERYRNLPYIAILREG
jgi:hypoxanthine phosphoribosyltransferase